MIEMPSVKAYGEKTEFGLALSSPRDPVLYTHPADQSVANPPQKGRRAIINN
jgi:hypothetical protein